MKQVTPDMEKRLRMAFNIYDVDGDGKISRDDLFNALKLMVGGGLKEKSLMEAVNRTWVRMAQKGEEDLMVMRGSFDNYLCHGALEETSDNFAPHLC